MNFLVRNSYFDCSVIFRLPGDIKKVFHPIICCALSADLAAFAYGYLSKMGLNPVLGRMRIQE